MEFPHAASALIREICVICGESLRLIRGSRIRRSKHTVFGRDNRTLPHRERIPRTSFRERSLPLVRDAQRLAVSRFAYSYCASSATSRRLWNRVARCFRKGLNERTADEFSHFIHARLRRLRAARQG